MVPGQRLRSESLYVHHRRYPARAHARDRQRQEHHDGSPRIEQAQRQRSSDEDVYLRFRQASFPGTIVAGVFQEYKSDEAGMDLHVYFKPTHQSIAPAYTTTAVQEFTYFITLYGLPPSQKLNLVETPGDTVPYIWAPEIAGLASPSITEKTNYRLLADAIAHQWWGVSVSPATKDDWWLSDGFSRYSEAMYVENAAGAAGLEEAVKDMSVGALAYDTVPLSSASKLDIFSTEFQSLSTDKGAMILHMLRWVLGEDKYNKTMRDFAAQYAGKSASTDDFREVAEKELWRATDLVLLAVARFHGRS